MCGSTRTLGVANRGNIGILRDGTRMRTREEIQADLDCVTKLIVAVEKEIEKLEDDLHDLEDERDQLLDDEFELEDELTSLSRIERNRGVA